MVAALGRKVPMRVEHTGNASGDRAQRMAQQVSQSHEITKSLVAALANRTYVALAADTGNVAAGAYATLLTATITTLLASGSLEVQFSLSGTQGAGGSGTFFMQIVLDGVPMKGAYTTIGTPSYSFTAAMVAQFPVKAGKHVVQLQVKSNNGGYHINAKTTLEEHADLLLQEAA